MPHLSTATPVGALTIIESDGAIVAVDWGDVPGGTETPLLVRARDQIAEYFAGRRRAFDLPLAPQGTAFRRKVWDALARVPYGATLTYGGLARALDSAPRAVGGACGANPIPILIPCHRIVGAGGQLTGYSGGDGVAVKRALLELEARHAAPASAAGAT